MPADLRERVARAIYLARDKVEGDPWDMAMARAAKYSGQPSPMIREAYEAADAALAAIREVVPHAIIISDGCHRLADRSTGIPALEHGWRDTANLLRALAGEARDA